MSRNEFQIEFTFEGLNYYGLVHAEGSGSARRYRVSLENEEQQSLPEILLLPSPSDLEDWTFECNNGEAATAYYEKELLEGIGGEIEAYINKKKRSGRTDD